MADYHYVSTWQLQAPIEQVWAALNDLEHLPVWYRGVQQAQELTPGDAQGIGRRVRYVIKGRCRCGWRSRPQPPGRIPAGPGTAGRGRAGRHRALVTGPAGRGHHRPLPLGCAHDQAVDEPAVAAGAAAAPGTAGA